MSRGQALYNRLNEKLRELVQVKHGLVDITSETGFHAPLPICSLTPPRPPWTKAHSYQYKADFQSASPLRADFVGVARTLTSGAGFIVQKNLLAKSSPNPNSILCPRSFFRLLLHDHFYFLIWWIFYIISLI